jgi:methylated-DNA-protein-cysteine methyltransferase-like protein
VGKGGKRGGDSKRETFYQAVWNLVRTVPRGRVVTYGQVATWLGSPRAARAVGYAMFSVREADVPWQRVVNHQGRISIGGALHRPERQRELLEQEGVELDASGRIDLEEYRWDFATARVRPAGAKRRRV